MKGKKHSDKTKEKCRKAHLGKKYSLEHNRNWSLSMAKSKIYECIETNEIFECIFDIKLKYNKFAIIKEFKIYKQRKDGIYHFFN